MSSLNINRYFYLLTFLEGVFFATMVASSESYALYYFTKKGLSDLEVAILSNFPLLCAAFTQLILPRIIRDSKLSLGIIIAYFIQILGLAGLCYSAMVSYTFSLLLLSLVCYWTGGQNSGLFWMDWISHYIPSRDFAQFISRRNAIIVATTLLLYLTISVVVRHSGFFYLVFFIGMLARSISLLLQYFLFRCVKDFSVKKMVIAEEGDELKPETKKILLIFFFWTGLLKFSTHISSCFFIPYMIYDLKLTLVGYVILTAIPYLGRALFLQNWGKASKGHRSFWGIQLSCIMVSTFPALWTLSDNYIFLMLLQLLSGMFWGGHELSLILMVQSVTYAKTRKWMGYHQAFMAVCTVLGAIIGAILLKNNFSYHFVFNLSSSCRFICTFFFLFHIHQYKEYALNWRVSKVFLYTILSLRPSLASIGRVILPLRTERKSVIHS